MVTWHNVAIDPSILVKIRICLLGNRLDTRSFCARFPLDVHENVAIELVFPLFETIHQLVTSLAGERLVVELIDASYPQTKVIASFSNEAVGVLFGTPPFIGINETRRQFLAMVLIPRHHRMSVASPQVNAIATTTISKGNLKDLNSSTGFISRELEPVGRKSFGRIGGKIERNRAGDEPRRSCERVRFASAKRSPSPKRRAPPFVVRHVDEKLIGRVPSTEPQELTVDRGFTTSHSLAESSRDTSRLETFSSLVRRKPKIVEAYGRSESAERSMRPNSWSYIDHGLTPHRTLHSSDPWWDSAHRYLSEDDPLRRGVTTWRDRGGSWDRPCYYYYDDCFVDGRPYDWHDCTVCELYRRYFGQRYPRH